MITDEVVSRVFFVEECRRKRKSKRSHRRRVYPQVRVANAVNSLKSTKSAKSPRSGRSRKKDVEKDADPQAQAEVSTKALAQKKESQGSIRRLIPSISPKMIRRRWQSMRGKDVQNRNNSDRSRKNVPIAAANQSNRQPKVASVRQPSAKAKEQPHPQSKQANKNLQPSENERSYVDRLLKRNLDLRSLRERKIATKSNKNTQLRAKKSKKMNIQKSPKTDSKKSQKKPKVIEPKIVEPKVEQLKPSPSPSKALSSMPKSQKVVKKAVKEKSPVAAAVKPSPITSSPNTPLLPPVPSRTPRRYCHTKDEDPGSIGQSKEQVPDAKTPLKSPPAQNATPVLIPSANVEKDKEESSSDESESEDSIHADEVLEQERKAGQKPEELQPVKVTKPPKVTVRPGELIPMNKEDANRIAKLRANAPKPKPQPKNAKEAKIHEDRIFKLKHDYPTMNDVLSDWDSADEAKVQNEKKKSQSSPEKNLK
ncbi:hypothetical protein M3Y98_00526900 [Aphelenchoides besseyi]|nr:hypothetical protein M3Y98_00526900 [Aphelenchoides besseyi]